MKNHAILLSFLLILSCVAARGMSVTVTTERVGGARNAETVPIVCANGVATFRWPAAKIPADAVRVTVAPDFATARKGEAGYFVFPGGQLGRFTRDFVLDRSMYNTEEFCKKADMPIQYIQTWMPVVAAAQLTKHKEAERELLEKWISVAEYQ